MSQTIDISKFHSIRAWLDYCDQHTDLTPFPIPDDILEAEADLTADARPSGTMIFRRPWNATTGSDHSNHPVGAVEQYGAWYHASGQDYRAGHGTVGMEYSHWTTDRAEAIRIVRQHNDPRFESDT